MSVLQENYSVFFLLFIAMMSNNREELIVDQDNGPTIKKFQRDNKGEMTFAYLMDTQILDSN